jgi:Tfp pilus assembly protein PilF
MAQIVFLAIPCRAQLRKIKTGDEMPEFSLPGPDGNLFNYKSDNQRVFAVVFLQANQKQSERAVAGVKEVIKELQEKAETFDFIAVIDGPDALGFYDSINKEPQNNLRFLMDTEYKLWGKLGIIAAPTSLIVGKDGKILWIKAGYGYDFAPLLRFHLNQALGIVGQDLSEESTQVETLSNTAVDMRVGRHLQMAKMLEKKGRYESAITEVTKAKELDPNSIEIVLELGELYCRANKGKEAMDTVAKIETESYLLKARVKLISGWANRQAGDLDAAEKYLLEATKLDPKSSRGFFELGKVYQGKGQNDKAMQSYHKALTLIFEE